jgi:hypothetical protein
VRYDEDEIKQMFAAKRHVCGQGNSIRTDWAYPRRLTDASMDRRSSGPSE